MSINIIYSIKVFDDEEEASSPLHDLIIRMQPLVQAVSQQHVAYPQILI